MKPIPAFFINALVINGLPEFDYSNTTTQPPQLTFRPCPSGVDEVLWSQEEEERMFSHQRDLASWRRIQHRLQVEAYIDEAWFLLGVHQSSYSLEDL